MPYTYRSPPCSTSKCFHNGAAQRYRHDTLDTNLCLVSQFHYVDDLPLFLVPYACGGAVLPPGPGHTVTHTGADTTTRTNLYWLAQKKGKGGPALSRVHPATLWPVLLPASASCSAETRDWGRLALPLQAHVKITTSLLLLERAKA
jgi:hypothetical protein